MIKAAVVEDNPRCREQIISFLKRYGESKNIQIEVTEFTDGMEITNNYRPCYHVIFLDIEMPLMDGMKAAHMIRKKDAEVVIVFITNVARYAVKGYEVGALDFILKPLRYEAFALKMNRIVRMTERPMEKCVVVSFGSDVYRIQVADLLYVEVTGHQVLYHTLEQSINVRGTLRDAEAMLLENGFEKCNNCYLVNLRHVKGIRDNFVLVGNERLQISRARKKGFTQVVADYIGSL